MPLSFNPAFGLGEEKKHHLRNSKICQFVYFVIINAGYEILTELFSLNGHMNGKIEN